MYTDNNASYMSTICKMETQPFIKFRMMFWCKQEKWMTSNANKIRWKLERTHLLGFNSFLTMALYPQITYPSSSKNQLKKPIDIPF